MMLLLKVTAACGRNTNHGRAWSINNLQLLVGGTPNHGIALSVSSVPGHESEHCLDPHSGCYGIHTSCPFQGVLFHPVSKHKVVLSIVFISPNIFKIIK